jgi:hypothetical protein
MNDHLRNCHGIGDSTTKLFECSLAGCQTTTSKFTKQAARNHLRVDHGMRHSAIEELISVGRFPRTIPYQSLSCQWPPCQAIRFNTELDLIDHQYKHINELCEAASKRGVYHCHWPLCRGERLGKDFNVLVAYETHLKTHLSYRFWCPHNGCTTTQPFLRKSDYRRHITMHARPNFYCPVESCTRNTVSFPRKDKLAEHARREHGPFQCLVDHCHKTMSVLDKESHLLLDHGADSREPDIIRDVKHDVVLGGQIERPHHACKTCTRKSLA